MVTCSKSKQHRMNVAHAHLKQRSSSWPPCKSWFAAYCQHGNRYIMLKAPLKFLLAWLCLPRISAWPGGIFNISFSSFHPLFPLFFEICKLKSICLIHLRQVLTETWRTTHHASGAGWKFCTCIRKQHKETQDKGQLQALFCIKLKRNGTHTHSYHEGIPAQQKPV